MSWFVISPSAKALITVADTCEPALPEESTTDVVIDKAVVNTTAITEDNINASPPVPHPVDDDHRIWNPITAS